MDKRSQSNIPGPLNAVITGLSSFWELLSQRWTVVLVPHSERRVYNLHLSASSIVIAILILIVAGGGLFWYGAFSRSDRVNFPEKNDHIRSTQASLDQLRDEVDMLLREAKEFETALSGTFSSMGPNVGVRSGTSGGDLSSFFDIQEIPGDVLPEVSEMRRLANYLQTAVQPVQEIAALLDSQNALLTEIPSMWPIKGGIGHISFRFGQNIHPFTKQYYIHKGIDLSTYRQGDPIVATADGQIVTVDYDPGGFGNYVIIKHKHGFYTRYAHMLSVAVTMGDRVQQGQTIGYIGNTGQSTGPHVHYEVHIGSDVVDPYQYLTIRSRLTRSTAR
ncbi:peptidase M23 [Spirochaetia bacterium]|nr:peptidase M23 [Spirochaetia bacterium]GHU34835.1 peptidase M23 [Spirochaetia bacterium]